MKHIFIFIAVPLYFSPLLSMDPYKALGVTKDASAWEILGVHRAASELTIKKAYEQLRKKWSQENNQDKELAQKVTKIINEAYQHLIGADDYLMMEYKSQRAVEDGQDISLGLFDIASVFSILPIPQKTIPLFTNAYIKSPIIVPGPVGIQQVQGTTGMQKSPLTTGFSIIGSIVLGDREVKIKVSLIRDLQGIIQRSVTLVLPKNWKISQTFPELSWLDAIPMPEGIFVISSFEYYDSEFAIDDPFKTKDLAIYPRGLMVKKGFNFVASVNLEGPLENLKKFLEHVAEYEKKTKGALILDLKKIVLIGFVTPTFLGSTFTISIPLRLGVDFTKLKNPPKLFKSLTTGDLSVIITAPSATAASLNAQWPTIGVTTGILLGLTTQEKLLSFYGSAFMGPTISKFSLFSENILNLKWIELNELGMQLDFDYLTLPTTIAVGVPFTGMGLRGKTTIGKEKPTVVEMTGYVSVKSAEPMDFLFHGRALDITLAKFIQLLSKMIKKEISLEKIPTMELQETEIAIVPKDMIVAGKGFKRGLGAEAIVNLFGLKGGIRFVIDPGEEGQANTFKDALMQGKGWLANIDTKVCKLTGVGADKLSGTSDDGPVLDLLIAPSRGIIRLFLNGMLEIPALNIKQSTDLTLITNGITGTIDAKVADLFDMELGLNLKVASKKTGSAEFLEIADSLFTFEVDFAFKNNFADALTQMIGDELEKTKKDIQPMIADLDNKIKEAIDKLNQAKMAVKTGTQKEIEKTRQKLREVEQELMRLKRACAAKKPIERVVAKSCWQIPGKEIEKSSLNTYITLFLKGGEAVVNEIILAAPTQLLSYTREKKLQNLKKILSGFIDAIDAIQDSVIKGIQIIRLKQAAGHMSTKELLDGRLAKLSVLELEFKLPFLPGQTFKLENLQFDFKNPATSMKEITLQLLKGIKFVVEKKEKKETIPQVIFPQKIPTEELQTK